jgi:hypothetical protein
VQTQITDDCDDDRGGDDNDVIIIIIIIKAYQGTAENSHVGHCASEITNVKVQNF